ncbi:ankyrin repeat domain-containing protein [Halomonas piscis]|uniref:DNA 3'-5' helicase II n=1 Tax=Halomonas piscis TaxID=3031727 RepID=A0ABY9Z3A0_9GAMM|nr:ankyrin repeat domain-containing protein [Halomonas piscis]WNK21156.1 ankyrin repeat domain-containing protein [Halomonas piscis]
MRVLLYSDLDAESIPGFRKLRTALEADNFRQADVRKIGDNLYRARLNKRDRVLFSLYRHAGETCCLILEYLRNHAYERSRFLAGDAVIDEDKIPRIATPEEADAESLGYLHPTRERFHLLDKILTFDDEQEDIFASPPPLVVVGSAGSGKTALILEKLKEAIGEVLYVSLSSYLVTSARDLYYAHGYDNPDQSVDFLSFQELLESIQVPQGRQVETRDFQAWFQRHRQGSGLSDPHKLYEEIRGVITGPVTEGGWRSREEYLELGVKQSIFPETDRPRVYDLFERYLVFLDEQGLYDPNLVAHDHLALVRPSYDFVVVDEVQDITNVQLYLILHTLREPGQFLLSGDANQIVHPNFFSWASVKSLFFHERGLTGHGEVVRILHANYRNAPLVTALANRILKLKHARFGSVDRESNYLVRSAVEQSGQVQLLENREALKHELDSRTARSTRFAVVVLHPEQKAEARRWFRTPLVFSIQEAKGLEYDSVILYNVISDDAEMFQKIARGVDSEALEREELSYRRAKDKHDKSLEIYKFFINALYVAVTRAVRHVYLVETRLDHPVLKLLQVESLEGELQLEQDDSSLEDWQHEARRLELQGKDEQAQAIREQILEEQPVPWTVLDRAGFEALRDRVLAEGGKKERLELFEYALLHHHRPTLNALAEAGFKPALDAESKAMRQLHRNHFMSYEMKHPTAVFRDTQRYGVDHRTRFGLTPLMIAARLGNATLVEQLIERGADPMLTANNGFTALHFALEQAMLDDAFARQRLAGLYPLLAPASLGVQVDGRLVKLDRRLMETFLLELLQAMFYRHLGPAMVWHQGYTAQDIEAWVARLPDRVLPPRRKRRQYLSSILSKNELRREDRYNRKLFLRLKRGHYALNPALKLRDGSAWIPLHQRFPLEDLDIRRFAETLSPQEARRFGADFLHDHDRWQRDRLDTLRRVLEIDRSGEGANQP